MNNSDKGAVEAEAGPTFPAWIDCQPFRVSVGGEPRREGGRERAAEMM